MKKLTATIGLLFLALLACSRKNNTLKIAGSDTMVQIGQHLAKAYMQQDPQKLISIQGGGSGTGIAALLNGSTDIASASREMKPEELMRAQQRGITVKEYVIANDALVIAVHPSNKISKLTIEQLSGIYAGKITNWSALGGDNKPILAISRDSNSGTHAYFKDEVLRQGKTVNKGEKSTDPLARLEFGKNVTFAVSSQAISDQVKVNTAAIGYLGIGWAAEGVKSVTISRDGKAFYAPTLENTVQGKYPLARGLQMYVAVKEDQKAIEFMNFVLSPEGQKIVQEQGFIPVKK
ncbi:MAG TPA: phosphate ABC transporter substrate-binding protein [Turneriella sp.]|nr:phosphate ABC transporter substrate-binding protein [Turneriella sp.]